MEFVDFGLAVRFIRAHGLWVGRMMDHGSINAFFDDTRLRPECPRRFRSEDADEAVRPVGRKFGVCKRFTLAGMGSIYAAFCRLWLGLVEGGTLAWLVNAAECLGKFMPPIDASKLVIAASQSGRSAETVALACGVRSRRSKLLAITNDVVSPLAQNADAVADIRVGIENAVSTKIYLNTLGLGITLDRILSQRRFDVAVQPLGLALAEQSGIGPGSFRHLQKGTPVP